MFSTNRRQMATPCEHDNYSQKCLMLIWVGYFWTFKLALCQTALCLHQELHASCCTFTGTSKSQIRSVLTIFWLIWTFVLAAAITWSFCSEYEIALFKIISMIKILKKKDNCCCLNLKQDCISIHYVSVNFEIHRQCWSCLATVFKRQAFDFVFKWVGW